MTPVAATQHDLVRTLPLQGDASSYARVSREAVARTLPRWASTVASCLRAYVSFDVQKLTAAEGVLRTLAGKSPGPCATAILDARTLLDRRRAVLEGTRVDSITSAQAGGKSSHQLEALEHPTGRLSHGLQAFDANGSGKIDRRASREVLRVN